MLKRNVFLFLVVIVMMSTACQPPAREISPLSEEDVAAIKSLGPSLDQKALTGDWDALLALMKEDVLLILPNSPVIKGRAAYKALIGSLGPTFSEHEIKFLEIDGCGDIAYARGTYAVTCTVKGVADPIEDAGNILAILRKQSDGSWLITIWMDNSKLPLPEEDSDIENK